MVVVCLLVVAIFWKGKKALIWLEELAGLPTTEKTLLSPNQRVDASPSPASSISKEAPTVVASPEKIRPAGTGTKSDQVEGTVPVAMLQPVVVTSVERVKNMDPKILELERRNRVENFLSALRVQGVRIQGPESRIMVDGTLISLGEPIGDFGLRLKSVESGRLIFVDEEGKEYLKSY
jgi:hypothetical protein